MWFLALLCIAQLCYSDAVTIYTRHIYNSEESCKLAKNEYMNRVVWMNLDYMIECITDIDGDFPISRLTALEFDIHKDK